MLHTKSEKPNKVLTFLIQYYQFIFTDSSFVLPHNASCHLSDTKNLSIILLISSVVVSSVFFTNVFILYFPSTKTSATALKSTQSFEVCIFLFSDFIDLFFTKFNSESSTPFFCIFLISL